MSQARVAFGGAVHTARRVMRAPEWPVVAAGLLGLFAMVEAVEAVDRGAALSDAATALPTSLLLALGTTLPVALARTHLAAAATLVTATVVLSLGTRHHLTVAGLLAEAAVLYLVGRHRSRWLAVLLVAPFAVHAILPLGGVGSAAGAECWRELPPQPRPAADCSAPLDQQSRLGAVLLLALAAAAPAAGWARRLRGEAVERDASQRVIEDTLLEHAARGARARIARELHDVVAHHISMIAVQAEAARLTTAGMPTEGARRLVAIGDTAREALNEMRRLLDLLREDAGAEVTRQPQPGVQQLIDLVDEARESSAGSVRLIVRGPLAPLAPGVELTAYRIVQEALTNVRRHAPGAAVDVELHYTADALHLRVRDNGPGPPGGADAGHGLAGMRERTAMVGGTLRVGAAVPSGFLVDAVLPATEASG